jgi:hypothetical protein
MKLVRGALPPEYTTFDGRKLDVITSLDPLFQTDAEQVFKRLDDAGVPYHFIRLTPLTGEIISYIAPAAQKWPGTGGSLDLVAPIILLPALTPDKVDRVKFTLASQISDKRAPDGEATLRRVFRSDRKVVLEKIIDQVGPERIAAALKEFGFKSDRNDKTIKISQISPMEAAANFCSLANLGYRVSPHPGSFSEPREPERQPPPRILIKSSVLFCLNYLLKNTESRIRQSPDTGSLNPSIFSALDEQGLWFMAYRPDDFVLLRVKDGYPRELRLSKIVDKLFENRDPDETPYPIPEGVIFRKICVHSGMRATTVCPKTRLEPFVKGTQPSEWCAATHNSTAAQSDSKTTKHAH